MLRHYKRMSFVTILVMYAALLLLGLLRYNPTGYSCMYADSRYLGASVGIADCLNYFVSWHWYLFGYATICLIPVLLVLAYCVVRRWSIVEHVERMVAVLLLPSLTAALMALHKAYDITAGGWIGYRIQVGLLALVDPLVAQVALYGSILALLILSTRINLIPYLTYSAQAVMMALKALAVLMAVPYKIMLYCKQRSNSASKNKQPEMYYDQASELHESEAMDLYAEEPVQHHMDESLYAYDTQDAVEDDEVDDTTESYVIPEGGYRLPHVSMFISNVDQQGDPQVHQHLKEQSHLLEQKLKCFGITGSVVAIKRGPVVTLFEYQPDIDAKISKITALEDDLALALQAMSIRIIAPIPGTAVVGFEVANRVRESVYLANMVHSAAFASCDRVLPLALGYDTIGNDVIVDLARMPHLLVAGSTGSGKSVALNTMLVSLLCKRTPDELKLILIDPKRLEFAAYADIAHLIFPIVTHPKKAIAALRWVVKQMEDRYERMACVGARNIQDYNALMQKTGDEQFAYLVVMIDELADLMMTSGKEIEDLIARIAQMARAAGIHLIVATQRPSVDVITGLIKVNFPSRISFRVTSKVDSRTILDACGADKLLGRGDMLYLDASDAMLKRLHGAYVSDAEIQELVNYIKQQRAVQYLDLHEQDTDAEQDADIDGLYDEVLEYLQEIDEVSISQLQRKFRIGYNRSARIIELLEMQGFIGPSGKGKTRSVLRQ